MPVINRKMMREKQVKYKHEKDNKYGDFYGSEAWRRLRNTYISLHPLCQECLEHNTVEPATEVHHIYPYLRGKDEQERWELFLDEKNLRSLCSKCHTAVHVKDRIYNMGRLDNLTDKEWKYAHGLVD